MEFCRKRGENPCSPPVRSVIEFLTELYRTGIGYSALNTARSALSCFVTTNTGLPIGKHPLVVRLLKGIFQNRPALPRNNITWDTNIVLNYLKQMDRVQDLSLKDLSLKLVTLIALVTGQRAQTMQLFDFRNRTITNDMHKYRIGDLVKQTRPGTHQAELELVLFPDDEKLCVVTCLQEYEQRTKDIRGSETGLLISYSKPHKRVSKATVSRWVRTMLAKAGINMNVFTAHSTRAASTSKASRTCVPLMTIMKTAGWSRTCTFRTFYDKPVHVPGQFANSILNSN